MKILKVLCELRPSGAEMMIKCATPYWIKEGCEVHVLALSAKIGEYASNMREAGCVVHHIPIQRGWKLALCLWRYFVLLQDMKPDVVHVHAESLSAFTTIIPRFLKIRSFRSILNSFPFSGRVRLQKICERAFQRIWKCYQIAISPSISRNEKAKLFNPTILCWPWFNDIYFHPPTFSERISARANLGLLDDQIVLLSVGNGNDVKNLSSIIEALALIQPTTASLHDPLPLSSTQACEFANKHNLIYLFVGNEHPHQLERKTAEKLSMSSLVRFCGPQMDLCKYREHLWAADVFLMPSKYEGFSIAALEGLSCGLNCIFADSPGLKDLKEFLFPIIWSGTDAASIAEKLLKMITEGGCRKINIESATAVRSEFGTERRSGEYLRLWKDAVSKKASG